MKVKILLFLVMIMLFGCRKAEDSISYLENGKRIKITGLLDSNDTLIIKEDDKVILKTQLKITGNQPLAVASGIYKDILVTCHRPTVMNLSGEIYCDVSLNGNEIGKFNFN